MSKKDASTGGENPLAEMTSEQASVAIQRASEKNPQLTMMRDKLIAAIENSEGGMEAMVRAIRSKLHEV
ncbi:hypothetical protein JZU48_01990 [bacterium]|nr:hypothetical protein [bacterium]